MEMKSGVMNHLFFVCLFSYFSNWERYKCVELRKERGLCSMM